MFLRTEHNGLMIKNIELHIVFVFDAQYGEYWLHSIDGKGLEKLTYSFGPTAFYDDNQSKIAIKTCAESTKRNGEFITSVAVEPDLVYACQDSGCDSAYYASILVQDEESEILGAWLCYIDAISGSVLQSDFRETMHYSVRAPISYAPYNRNSGLTTAVPYAGIYSSASGTTPVATTDATGNFTTSCTTCYLRPSSPLTNDRFQNWYEKADTYNGAYRGWITLGPWNAQNEPNKTFVINPDDPSNLPAPPEFPDGDVDPDEPSVRQNWRIKDAEYIRQFQAYYWLNWMYDTVEPYTRSVKASGNNGRWVYQTFPSSGASSYSGDGYTIYLKMDDNLNYPQWVPLMPSPGTMFHELGHGIDDSSTTGTGFDGKPGYGYERRNEPIAVAISSTLAKYYRFAGGTALPDIDLKYLPADSATNFSRIYSALSRASWVFGWDNAVKMLIGGDTNASGGQQTQESNFALSCNTTKAYITGFMQTDTFQGWPVDTVRCPGQPGDTCEPFAKCWDLSKGTKCNNGSGACPSAPPQMTFKDYFNSRLSERGVDYYGFEISKLFRESTEETCPSGQCLWDDDITNVRWFAPLLEKINSFGSADQTFSVFNAPEANTSVMINNSPTGLLSLKGLDSDYFSFFGAYNKTYYISAASLDSRDLALEIRDDYGMLLTSNNNCNGNTLDPCITFTSTSMGYYYIRVYDINGQEGTYSLGFRMVGDDYADNSPDGNAIAMQQDAVTSGSLNSTTDTDFFRVFINSDAVSLPIQLCSSQAGQTLGMTIYRGYRDSSGRWRHDTVNYVNGTSSTICDTYANVTLPKFSSETYLPRGWYFFKVYLSAGTPGAYKIRPSLNLATLSTNGTRDNPIIICDSQANPFSTSCKWDVMYNDTSRDYIYRNAGYLNSSHVEDWYLIDLPEQRRVTISATNLRDTTSSSWLEQEIELRAAEDAGLVYYNANIISDKPILRADDGGLRQYYGFFSSSSTKNTFLPFTVAKSGKYFIVVRRKANQGAYMLATHVHRSYLNAPVMPDYLQ